MIAKGLGDAPSPPLSLSGPPAGLIYLACLPENHTWSPFEAYQVRGSPCSMCLSPWGVRTAAS